MPMISYWKDVEEIYVEDDFVLIIGRYNHKNINPVGSKALGVHWGDYPRSRGILSPCVIPESTRNAIISGLLHKAVINNNETQTTDLIKAIKFFVEI
jgi:hypothetical protein